MTKPNEPPPQQRNGYSDRESVPQSHRRRGSSPDSGSESPPRTRSLSLSAQQAAAFSQHLLLASIAARAQVASRSMSVAASPPSGLPGGSLTPLPRERGSSRRHLLLLLEEVLRIIDDDGVGVPELE